MICIKSV